MSAEGKGVVVGDGSARADVAFAVAGFLARTELERLRLFRRFLQATVTGVSPLLLDLAAREGLSLAETVGLILPPQDWPWRPLAEPAGFLARSHRRRALLGSVGPNGRARFRREFAHPGVVVRDAGSPGGRLGIRPLGSVLGFTAEIGGALLSAFGPSAMLRLPAPLPETLALALPGRTLDGVVGHPLIDGRDYVIRRVLPDVVDGLPVVTFGAALVPIRMPWGGNRADGERAL